MTGRQVKTTLIFCIHNHQPVGNLPQVFEQAYRDAYLPFLEALERHPGVKFALHNTGPLLEWYEEHAPEYIEKVRSLVRRGQLEVLTGAFYEPILPAVPERDALSQISRMTGYVEDRFGLRPRGMWLAERVWEPRLARTIAEAGVEYVPLDDYEFRLAGLPDADLVGHFLTEEQGVPLRLFPISKALRYAIPFAEPERTIEHLRALAERGPGLMALFGDDGEKFGVWPGTREHVYAGGWLERFLSALEENSSWLATSTFADFVDREASRGRVYLPAASYPEMMEWALPTPARRAYAALIAKLKERGEFEGWGAFLAGGTWKGFLAKYDESNIMARKMMRVSAKVAAAAKAVETAGSDETAVRRDPVVPAAGMDAYSVAEARTHLWKGQCNCAYWHGVFGGLYLPHLRAAVYEHLIEAERLVDSPRGRRWDAVDVRDHDLDGRPEVLLESHWANAYVSPSRGGTLFEIDARVAGVNLLGVMSRYEEAYHGLLSRQHGAGGEGVASIHDAPAAKEAGLSRYATPDRRPRRSAVDRFFPDGMPLPDAQSGASDAGDFEDREYAFSLVREDGAVGVDMSAEGRVRRAGAAVRAALRKTVWLEPDRCIRVDHEVAPESALGGAFASEWNLAFLTAHEDYLRVEFEDRRSSAGRPFETGAAGELRFVDSLRSLVVSLKASPAASFHVSPIETVSQSEGGFERVFQGLSVVPWWDLPAGGGRFTVTLCFERPGGRT